MRAVCMACLIVRHVRLLGGCRLAVDMEFVGWTARYAADAVRWVNGGDTVSALQVLDDLVLDAATNAARIIAGGHLVDADNRVVDSTQVTYSDVARYLRELVFIVEGFGKDNYA